MSMQVADAPEPVHVVALSGCHTLADKIRYACEHTRGATTEEIWAWLARYGVIVPREFLAEAVTAWQFDNDPADTTSRAGGRDRGQDAAVRRPGGSKGARGFYVAAWLSLAVSFDTAWRFFGDVLGITGWERPIMFAVVEVGLIAAAYGMRAGVIDHGRPGPARYLAWLLCGLAGYMALVLSGPVDGLARVALGPLAGLLFVHHALGIEVRARTGHPRAGTWLRIGRELRERVLSRLGLADDARDAAARTRDRAARRAARLALARVAPFRSVRVTRAIARSGVAHDPVARARMLAELAAIRHARELATLDLPSPWQHTAAGVPPGVAAVFTPGPLGCSVNGGLNTSGNAAVNTPAPGANTPGGRVGEHRARAGGNGRTRARKPPARRKLADYLAEAREHLAPGVTAVTPAWVREVIPGCPRSTSKSVADALNKHLQNSDGGEATA